MAVAAVTGTTFSMAPLANTTTLLRAVLTAIEAALASAGLVRTTDTGQIDTTTVTYVTSSTYGYSVWRFSDSLQATRPVFIRILYTSQSTGQLYIAVIVGSSTDGAGTITSNATYNMTPNASAFFCGPATAAMSQASTSVTASGPSFCYGDTSSVVLSLWPNSFLAAASNAYGGTLWVERSRDADGTINGDGVMLGVCPTGVSVTASSLFLAFSTDYAQQTITQNVWPIVMYAPTSNYTSGIKGGAVYVCPVITGCSPRIGGPSALLVSPFRNDFPAPLSFTLTHYGTARTFVAVVPSGALMNMGIATSIVHGLAVRTT